MEEDVLRAIIRMDRETSQMVKNLREEGEKERRALADELLHREDQAKEEAKVEGNRLFQEILDGADKEVARLESENRKKYKEMEERYDKYEEELLERAFREFVLENNG